METNFKKKHFSTDIVNKRMSSKISDINNDIDKKEKPLLSKNRCLLSAEKLTKDDEPWKIEEDSDCEIIIDSDVSPSYKVLILDAEKNCLVPHKKFKCLSDEDKLKELETEGELNLPTAKKIKPNNFTKFLEMPMTKELTMNDLKLNNKKPQQNIQCNKEISMNLNQDMDHSKHSSNLPNSTCFAESNDLDSKELETNTANCFGREPSMKKLSAPSWSNDLNSPSCSKDLYRPSCSKDLYSPSCSKDLYRPSCSKDLYTPSCSKDLYAPSCSKDLYGPSCSKDLYGPSCSKDLYNGPSCSKYFNSSNSKNLPGLSNLTNSSAKFDSLHSVDKPSVSVDIDGNLKMNQEEEIDLLLGFYNKSYLNESSVKKIPEEKNESIKNIKVINLNEPGIIKELLNSVNKISEHSPSSSGHSKCFEEDPDFVNVDIMYNIDLNNHLKQMIILTEKISKTTNDFSLVDECLQLIQIPQIESIKKTFTAVERQNFANGNSQWEYEIEKDDWNKIMVKRAAIFTSHAGFSIANEESLYVLADVAINYIKKLAKIVKKNFDIPSKSSCSDIFDPLTCSLQEIGVKGGIVELFKHYENDIFGKRDKLMKKCLHLKKIIDQYLVRLLLDPKMKNKCTRDKLEEENSCGKVMKNDEKVFQPEKITESETHKTKIQSMFEEIKLDSLSSTEKTTLTNAKLNEQQIEPIYVDNTDNESKMDIDSNNCEKIKADIVDSIISTNDKKINSNKKFIDSLIVVDNSNIDLLQPIETTLAKYKGKTSSTEKECSSIIDLKEQKKNVFGSKKPENCEQKIFDSFNQLPANNPPISRKLSDKADQPIMDQNYIFKNLIKEFDDEFELYKAKPSTKTKISTRNLPFTQFYQNVANDSLSPTHTVVYVNTNSKQASLANKNSTN